MNKLKWTLASLMALISTLGLAQNLVPNPSFEDFVECPISLGDFDNSVGWSNYSQTADHFHSCHTEALSVSVPSNWYGFQYPNSGDAYCGMISYTGSNNYREIIGAELLSPLIIGQKYYASMHVCSANETIESGYGANRLGFKFTNSSYDVLNPIPIDNFAHIYSDSIVVDTLNWVRLFGSFTADSAYTHVAIGNFFDINNTDTIDWSGWGTQVAYYFIDDISVSTDSLFMLNTNNLNSVSTHRKFNIYPNPTNQYAILQFDKLSQANHTLTLYDIRGRSIKTIVGIFTEEITIDTSELPCGIYIFQMHAERQLQFTGKLFVE